MNFWFDTEFRENGITIKLISVGVVCEDNTNFYVEVEEFNFNPEDTWLSENVKPYLKGSKIPYREIGPRLKEWVLSKTDTPVFWAYYGDYDWVALCQLYGKMIDLSKEFPKICLDLKQELIRLSVKDVPISNNCAHNALDDAIWTKNVHEWLIHRKGI